MAENLRARTTEAKPPMRRPPTVCVRPLEAQFSQVLEILNSEGDDMMNSRRDNERQRRYGSEQGEEIYGGFTLSHSLKHQKT